MYVEGAAECTLTGRCLAQWSLGLKFIRFRRCILPEKVSGSAVGVYRLVHGGSYATTGVAMNVGKTTAYEPFCDVVNGLYELRNEYIKFSTTAAETAAPIATFSRHFSELPSVVGAIGGTHIKIRAHTLKSGNTH